MAEEIYKEWFVRLRFPGYQDTKFFDQGGKEVPHGTPGALPEGWEEKKLNKVFDFISRGITPIYKEYSNFYAINQKVNKGKVLEKQYLKELDPSLNVPVEKYAQKGDILLNSLGEGTLGRVHFYYDLDGTYPIDQHMSILRSNSKPTSFVVYMFLQSSLGQGMLDLMKVGGTNMTMLNLSDLKKFKVVLPRKSIVEDFYKFNENQVKLKQNLLDKNQILQETRDLLLPRLISGKLNVEDLEINKAENLLMSEL